VPYVILGAAQLAVGAAAIFARYALEGAGPLAVSASRLTIAAIVLLIVAAFRPSAETAKPGTRDRRILAFAGVALGAHFAGWIWSLEYTTVAVSTLLVTSTPIWTALYDAIVLRRLPSRRTAIAFGTGALGLIAVVGFDRSPPPQPGHTALGVALALAGSIAIGAYLILVREVRERLDTRAIVTRTYSWAAGALLIAALAARQPPPPLDATTAWGGILAMAIVSQLLGHTAINASLRWFSPSAISFATVLEPVFAGALALALFHEAVPPAALIGAVVLLVSVAVVLREERQAFETDL
jgi:drug/metabolite transporter (DMT)-like permease